MIVERRVPAGSAFADVGLRVAVVGDDLVAGVGDPRALGWVGRVAARTSREAGPVTVFPLGIPGETTAGLLARWSEEAVRRFPAGSGASRLVIGLGDADLVEGITLPRSRLNLATILDGAESRLLPTFVVGPPPTLDDVFNLRLADLAGAYADVCQRRGVPFVDTFGPLRSHEDWLTDLAAGDGRHPQQGGYGLMAWLVLHGGWAAFVASP